VLLHQLFSQQHKPEDLSPLGNDVAHDLSPFGLRIHRNVQGHPADTREQKEDTKGMVAQQLENRAQKTFGNFAALGRANFIQILGRKYGHQDTRPVSHGIAEERTQMGTWIGHAV